MMIDYGQLGETEMKGAYFVQNRRCIQRVYLRVLDVVRALDARGPRWRASTRGIPVVALRGHRPDAIATEMIRFKRRE